MELPPLDFYNSIATQHLHGAHSPTSLEWWYFTGHVWKTTTEQTCDSHSDIINLHNRKAPDYALQSTFFLADEAKPKGLLAHAAEANIEKKQHRSSERAAGFAENSVSNPLAYAFPGILNLSLGHWRLNQLGNAKEHLNWDLRFDVRGTEYLLHLKVPKGDMWFHGDRGILKKTSDTENFYYTNPLIIASGQRIERTSAGQAKVEPVCGQLWFDHEIHVKKVMEVGWRWFGLTFKNGDALMLYQISQKGVFAEAKGELWDGIKKTSVRLQSVKMTPENVTCLNSKRCYPQSFQITFTDPRQGTQNLVTTKAWFAEQEMGSHSGGLARPYWEGGVQALWKRTSNNPKSPPQMLEGIGFTELVPQESKK
jgi:predicted secreted hydrolase